MPKSTWIIASVLSGVVIIAFVVLNITQQKRETELVRKQLASVQAAANVVTAKANEMVMELERNRDKIAQLEQEKAENVRAQQSLESEMRSALESKDVTISQLQGKLTVNILDRILFDSGEAILKPEGESILLQVAKVLAQYPNRPIHVIGHTDNVPIRVGSRGRHASNWELSTARATSAVRYLSEKAGVDVRRLAAVGYGEFHPVADNSTAEGRARNRRIALVVMPEEFAAPDVRPAAGQTNAPTALTPTNAVPPAADPNEPAKD